MLIFFSHEFKTYCEENENEPKLGQNNTERMMDGEIKEF